MDVTSISLSPGGSKVVTARPADAGKNPGLVGPNPPNWQSQNATIATVSNVSADGFTATVGVLSTAAPGGSAAVKLTGADADGNIISSTLTVNVQEADATQYIFSV